MKELKRFAKKLFPSLEVLDVIGGACVTARVEKTKKYVFRTKTTTRTSFPRRPSASLRSWTRSPPAPTLPRAGAATRQSARTRSEGLRVSESLFFSFCRYFPLPPSQDRRPPGVQGRLDHPGAERRDGGHLEAKKGVLGPGIMN